MRPVLVGDIGGTNARFALADLSRPLPRLEQVRGYLCADFTTSEDAVRAYFADAGVERAPEAAVIAVAGPVKDGALTLTNAHWRVSEAGLRGLGMARARLVNDYIALARAAPLLGEGDLRLVGGPASAPRETLVVLGPGTGFGVSALVREDGREAAAATEGGHVGFAPVDETEIEVLRRLTARFGRVSIERILSGPGLVNLHEALCDVGGAPCEHREPEAIARAAASGHAGCAATLERFWAILGSVAGDFALGLGARGGAFIAGGVAQRLADSLAASRFRERFEAKGRFEGYLREIPTWLITHPNPALLGAADMARDA